MNLMSRLIAIGVTITILLLTVPCFSLSTPSSSSHPSASHPSILTSKKPKCKSATSKKSIIPRRDVIGIGFGALTIGSLNFPFTGTKVWAAETLSSSSSSSAPSPSPSSSTTTITHRLLMDVRVSRSDGSFYTKDPELESQSSSPEDRVLTATLTIGLFGDVAPGCVEQFLKYIDVEYKPGDDDPLPSYARSTFQSVDKSTGLLVGGSIPGLEIVGINGATVIKYSGRILPAPLWAGGKGSTRLSHDRIGMLTHRDLDVSPCFGVLTRPCPELDPTHTVFGEILTDEGAASFLGRVGNLPTYSLEAAKETEVESELAADVFKFQREFFRGAAKTFGDNRLEKVYEGKILRRVEVTRVRLIKG